MTRVGQEDGTKHAHKIKGQEESTTVVTIAEPTPIMKIINAKLDRIVTLLLESSSKE